jgi:hypothetical protein
MSFNSALHPRDRNGRFVSKTTYGVRVGTRSVSATVGKRFPLIPGKVNVYVGGLVRIENASRSKGPIDRMADKIQDRVVQATPDRAKGIVGSLLGTGQFREGSTLITASTGRRSRATVSARRTTGGAKNTQTTGNAVRSPNRKPRQARQPRARKVAA